MDPHANLNPFRSDSNRNHSTASTAASNGSLSPTDRRPLALDQQETASRSRSISPTDRTQSQDLDNQETLSPSRAISPTARSQSKDLDRRPTVSRSRSVSPTDRSHSKDLDKQPTATDSGSASPKDRSESKELDKHPTFTRAISGHPHLQAARSRAHNAKRDAKQLFHLDSIHATGPSDRFNPTNVRVHIRWKGASQNDGEPAEKSEDEKYLLWRSRDNRKRRASSVVPALAQPKPLGPRLKAQAAETGKILLRMFTTFPYWDMAFWSGWSYTWGSVLFVMDGSWAYMEAAMPGSVTESVSTYGGPMCFFIGALLYQLGAVMAYLEAVNDGSFRGSAMRRFLEGHEDHSKSLVDQKIHSFLTHFTTHRDEETLKATVSRRGAVDMGPKEEGNTYTYTTWRWWPSWHMLRTHHIYEIGYLACAIQLFGATLYGMCGVVALPGVLSSLHPWQKEAAYWIPQIVASVCFLTASVMFTLENTEKWWRPEWLSIGWWIGIWAGIGSVGFLLLAIFGTMEYDYEWGAELADLTTIWGSTAYLFSSFLQWYEAVDKREQNSMLEEGEDPKPVYAYPMPMDRDDRKKLRSK